MIEALKLALYIKQHGEQWADELPDNCPPEEVYTASDETFYRMTFNEDRVVPEDWVNYLQLHPERNFTAEQRIYAAGLSLMDSEDAALNKMKLPGIKRLGFKGLAKISLIPEDGVILQTTNENSHYTWWRTRMCNLAKAEMV